MLDVPGAVPAAGPDAGVAAHYGDPAREQRRLERGEALVELPYEVVTVTGADRLGWLDTLSSQRLRDLAPGASAELLLLDVHGRIEHQAWAVEEAESAAVFLITESGGSQPLAEFLDSMRFMLDIQVATAPDLVVLGAVAPPDRETARLADSELIRARVADPWPGVVPGGTRYSLLEQDDAAHPGRATPFVMLLVAQDRVAEVVAAARTRGVTAAGMLAWEALRVAAWRPRSAREVDEKSLPHELDWLRTAVHLSKGCYRGQEGVARTFNLGRPPRRVVMLHLDGSDHLLPEPGADIGYDGRRVGTVTTVARHHELGPIALAVLKRTVPADAALEVAGPAGPIAASQEVVVGHSGFGEGRPEAHGPVTPGLRRRQ